METWEGYEKVHLEKNEKIGMYALETHWLRKEMGEKRGRIVV